MPDQSQGGRSARKYVVDATPPVLPVLTRCNVIGPSDGGMSDCDIADVFILQRFLAGQPGDRRKHLRRLFGTVRSRC